MGKDIEYMIVETTGLEAVVFSSNKLKNLAGFTKLNYREIKKYRSTGQVFKFEGVPVQIIAIDMNHDYERRKK